MYLVQGPDIDLKAEDLAEILPPPPSQAGGMRQREKMKGERKGTKKGKGMEKGKRKEQG